MKLKTIYVCQFCQAPSPKWAGQCDSCKKWNCLHEETINVGKKEKSLSPTPRALVKALNLSEQTSKRERHPTNIGELDRVLGGGITQGSLILLSGAPGIGKSTLTLKIAYNLSQNQKTILISGEESLEQISQRAERLKLNGEVLALNTNNLEEIINLLESERPQFAVIDSIQVIQSQDLETSAGSISQVRHCTEKLMQLAKSLNISIFLIGHVNKNGHLAGPKVLEHLVDTVLHLEGDRYQQLRILRSIKNRFGQTNEIGLFEMQESGLIEVKNPSAQLIGETSSENLGSAITVTIEGTRPILAEVQALVTNSHFGYPKRTATGFDLNRLQMLIAVLEKHAKLKLADQDVYINIVGGIKLKDPAADLAIIAAMTSSLLKKPLPAHSIIWGEAGLTGELRQVNQADRRKKEAQSLGYKNIISPEKNKNIRQTLKQLFS